jgi:hypothetical protein
MTTLFDQENSCRGGALKPAWFHWDDVVANTQRAYGLGD